MHDLQHTVRVSTLAALLGLLLAAPLRVNGGSVPLLRAGEETYVALDDLAVFYGLQLYPSQTHYLRLKGIRSELIFETGHRRAWVNGVEVWLHVPVRRIDSRWAIAQTDMQTLVDPVLRTHAHLSRERPRVVVLDPGHGGHDPGAVSHGGLQEKKLTLAIARGVQKELVAQGVDARLTRADDTFIPLPDRSRIAREEEADLFVSIHFNSASSPSAQGIETYLLSAPGYPSAQAAPGRRGRQVSYDGNGFDGVNTCLAYALQKSMVKETDDVDRGLRHARFAVLKHAPCPAALVECGFLSNRQDENQFRQPGYLQRLARGVSHGILAYVDAVKRAQVVAPPDPEVVFRASGLLTRPRTL